MPTNLMKYIVLGVASWPDTFQKYRVVEVSEDEFTNLSHEEVRRKETRYQGPLVNCEAWIRLKEKGQLR